MTRVQTVFVHSSEIYFEGFRSLLSDTPFSVSWRTRLTHDLESDLPARWRAGKRPTLFVLGEAEDVAAEIERIRAACVEPRIVLIGAGFTAADVLRALRCGAHGYIDDRTRGDAIASALAVVMDGAVVLPPDFARDVAFFGGGAQDGAAASASSDAQAPEADEGDEGPACAMGAEAAPQAPAEPEYSPDAPMDAVGRVTPKPTVRETAASKQWPREQRELAPATVSASQPFGRHAVENGLSAREAQILRCLVRGDSNKEIARELDLAETTVKVHLKTITRKIRVRNRTQAAVWAYDRMRRERPAPAAPQPSTS